MLYHYELAASAHPWFRTNIAPFHTPIVRPAIDVTTPGHRAFWTLRFTVLNPLNPAISSYSQGDDRLVTINSSCRLRTGLCIIRQGAPFLIGCVHAAHWARTPCPFRLNLPYTLSPQKKQQVRSHPQIFFPSRRRSLPLKLSFLRPLNPPSMPSSSR